MQEFEVWGDEAKGFEEKMQAELFVMFPDTVIEAPPTTTTTTEAPTTTTTTTTEAVTTTTTTAAVRKQK